MYAWCITRDLMGENLVGISGPRNATLPNEQIKAQGRKFRMLDADQDVCCEGYLVGGDGFEPLDDYGMTSLGCTIIQFFENGTWQTL